MALEQFTNGELNSSIRAKINANFAKMEPEYGTTFTGVFNFAKYSVSYANYITAGTIALSASTTKYNGAVNKVLIKGGITITKPVAWSMRGSAFTTDNTQWNEIYVQYEQGYVTIINTVLDASFQVVEVGVVADTTAPTFIATYPQSSNITQTTLDVLVQLNEIGTAYLTVVPNNTAAPTSQEVKDGTATGAIASRNVAVTAASTNATMNISGLSAGTAYDIYVVAEDDETTPNLQASPVKLDITTTAGADVTAPTISTATVENASPSTLTVVFSEVVTITNTTGLTIAGAATPTLSAPTGSGTNTLSFTLSAALTSGQAVTLEVAGTNNIIDAASNALAVTSKAITNNVVAVTVESKIQATGEWYNFTNKSIGAFTGAVGAKGNYTTTLASATPEYVAGTKLKLLRAENDAIGLGSSFAHLKNATDGISIFMKFAPLEIGYTSYFLGETNGNHQIIIGFNSSNQMYILTKMGTATLAINTTTDAIWSGVGPYTAKNLFIEIVKSTGAVNFYDGTTLLTKTSTAAVGDITLYNPIYNWYLGGRNQEGALDSANDISAEFEHLIINPQLFTASEKQFLIDNV